MDENKTVQIIPLGEFVDQDGRKFSISEDDVKSMVAARAAVGRDLVVDYNHQTITASALGGEAPAAGWIKSLVNRGADGLWALVDWTDKAREEIRAGAYKYLSAYIRWDRLAEDGQRHRIFLDHAALTNWPWIQGIKQVAATTQTGDVEKSARIAMTIDAEAVHSARCSVHSENQEGEQSRKNGAASPQKGEEEKMEKLKKFLMAWLGLAEGTSDEDIETKALEALEKIVGQGEEQQKAEEVAASARAGKSLAGTLAAVRKTLGLGDDATETAITGKIVSLTARADTRTETEKRLAVVEKELGERRRDDLVAVALTAGKISPAQKDWADEYALKDPEGFQRWAKEAPQVVSLGAMARPENRAAQTGLTDSERAMAKKIGVTEEIYLKHNPRQ